MRLKKYINEGAISDEESLVTAIFNDCKPFLKEFIPIYKSIGDFLYRGAVYKDFLGRRQ